MKYQDGRTTPLTCPLFGGGGTMTTISCKRCGSEVVQKPRGRLAVVGVLMLAGMGMGALWPPLWGPAAILGLAGAYLLVWASAGRGRWCRGCKRFEGV